MRKQNIAFELTVYDSLEELSKDDHKLMTAAVVARKKAYAPYSNFKVGAAVLLENGEIVTGNNQENASYPSGLCGERVAIFYAGANYPNVVIKSIAISATSSNYVVDKPQNLRQQKNLIRYRLCPRRAFGYRSPEIGTNQPQHPRRRSIRRG